MNTYLLELPEETNQLEDILETLHAEIIYTSKHTPILAIQSPLSKEEIQASLPTNYALHTNKEYTINDDTK